MLFSAVEPFVGFTLAVSQSTPVDLSWVKKDDVVVIRLKEPNVSGLKASSVISALVTNAAVTQSAVVKTLKANNAEILNQFWLMNAILVKVSDPSVLKDILAMPGVESVHPNFVISVGPVEKKDYVPPGPPPGGVTTTWGVARVGAPFLWKDGTTGTGIRVAVLDTGVDIAHPALAGKMAGAGPYYPGGWIEYNAFGISITGSVPVDDDGHGTHTSGTVLGGVVGGTAIGVAPGATLMHARVLPGGLGTFAQILAGMQWSVSPTDAFGAPAGLPANVVSMSFGGDGRWNELIPGIAAMKAAGVIPVCSIGNDGPGTSGSPGNYYNSFAVGATDVFDNIAYFSGGGVIEKSSFPTPLPPSAAGWPSNWLKPDVSAPGVDVVSSVPGGGLEAWSGTSMAAPHVAGAIALLKQKNPDWTADQIIAALQTSAKDLGAPGKDVRYGYGLIDLIKAVGGVLTDPKVQVAPEKIEVIVPTGQYIDNVWMSIFNVGGSELTFSITDAEDLPAPASLKTKSEVQGTSQTPADGKVAGVPVKPKSVPGALALVIKDIAPWGTGGWPEQGLVDLGIPFDIITSDMFASQSLTSYKFIVIASDQPQSFYNNMAASTSKLESWVSSGGKLEAHACDVGWGGGTWSNLLPGGVTHVTPEYVQQNYIYDPTSPIVSGLTDADFYNWNYVSHGYFANLPAGTKVIMGYPGDGGSIKPTVIEYNYGFGKVVATMQTWEWCKKHGFSQNGKIIDNTMYYLLFGIVPNGWITEYPPMGAVAPGGEAKIQILINALTMPNGDYYAQIYVDSNDPEASRVTIPVHLHVGPLPPDMTYTPDKLKVTVNPNQIETRKIEIGNKGPGDLYYEVFDFPTGPGPGAAKVPSVSTDKDVKKNADYGPVVAPTDGVVVEGDKLKVGISNMGELDYAGASTGFWYKPAAPYADGGAGSSPESLATGWQGEGYVLYYDGITTYTYPSNGASGLVPVGMVIKEDADQAKVDVITKTADGKLQVTSHFFVPKHDRIVILNIEFVNTGTSPIGDIKFKRVVDWDCNLYAGDDTGFDWVPEYYLLKADDVSGDPDGEGPLGPRAFSYGVSALYPRENVYDWDLNAWDDYMSISHGDTYVPDGPVDGDYNVAMYFKIGALMPGERKEIALIYAVGEGNTPEESQFDLISAIGGGGFKDAPWVSEKPRKGVVKPGETQSIEVTFDPRGMDPGSYYASIYIPSNDPKGVVEIPVVMHIRPGKPVIEDPAEGKSPDIIAVYEQLTEDAIILSTELAKPEMNPVVIITSLDTDGKASTGAKNRYTNDIGADYMLYSICNAYGPMSLSKSDLSAYKAAFPGVKFDSISFGYYYLYKWEPSTSSWSIVFMTEVKIEDNRVYHFWIPLVLMNSDGDMGVVQASGNLMRILDWAPDTGHGKTMPNRNIAVESLWIDEATGWTDTPAEFHVIVENTGEKTETFTVEFYAKRTGAVPSPTAAAPAPPATPFYTATMRLEPNTKTGLTTTFSTATSGAYEIKASVPLVGKETNTTDNEKAISYVLASSHDLAATAITTTSTPYVGQTDAKVLVTVVNQGQKAEAGAQIELKVADKVYSTTTFSIALGETKVVEIPWIPAKTGATTLKASIKPITGEDDIADNVVTGSVTVIAGHDLAATTIATNPTEPYLGQADAKVLVTVVNQGLAAETSQIELKVADKVYSTTTFSIALGETKVVEIPWIPAKTGATALKATIKTVTGEEDVADNVVTGSVTVGNGHDVKVDTVTVVNADPTATKIEFGDIINVTAVVKNVGGFVEYNVTVELFTDDGPGGAYVKTDEQIIASMDKTGETSSATVVFQYNIAKLGARKLKVVATPVGADITPADNTKAVTYKAEGADLAVTAITTTPSLINPGKATTIKVTFENRGSTTFTSTTTFTVKVINPDTGEVEKSLAGKLTTLAAGKTVTISVIGWKPTTTGPRIIRVEAPVINDQTPLNNALDQLVSVISPTWKLKVTTAAGVKAGDPTQVTIQLVDRDGNPVKLAGLVLELSVYNGKLSAMKVVTNEDGAATVTLTAKKPGSVKVCAKITGTAQSGILSVTAVK